MTQEFYFLKVEFTILKGICTPMFTATFFTIAKTWEQPSVQSWMYG